MLGKYLLAMCGDAQNTLHVWDWAGGDLLCSRKGSMEKITSVIVNQFSRGFMFLTLGSKFVKYVLAESLY